LGVLAQGGVVVEGQTFARLGSVASWSPRCRRRRS